MSFLVIFSLIIFYLSSCNNEKDIKVKTNTNIEKNIVKEKEIKENSIDKKNISLALKNKKEIKELEKEITIEDIIFRKKEKNNILLNRELTFLDSIEKTKDIE
jgi:hypothetical protein